MRRADRELIERFGPIVRDSEPRRFAPGFPDRVMERIRAGEQVPVIALSRILQRQFLRLAPAATALLLALAGYTLIGLGTSGGQSALEATLGLEPLTVETAYALGPGVYPSDDP